LIFTGIIVNVTSASFFKTPQEVVMKWSTPWLRVGFLWLLIFVAAYLILRAPVQAQPLERFHLAERPLQVVAEENSVCGPYFQESSKLELPSWFKTKGTDGKIEQGSLEKSAWLVIDNGKATPTFERFATKNLNLDVFRMSETDAKKSPCLRAVSASNVGKRWRTVNWISGLAQNKKCDYLFTVRSGTKNRIAFLVFTGHVGVWQELDKRDIWVILESDAKYQEFMLAETFRFDTYRGSPGITLIHTSPNNYEKTKVCLPPPD
jgi:hypothetical protein